MLYSVMVHEGRARQTGANVAPTGGFRHRHSMEPDMVGIIRFGRFTP